ncbi:phage terminase small subunit P27 family [Methylosinus sp. Ce-a6]|uniref:phage terminase small subunit P27 family n=1 Tax=Methylosinus sp. Ce-a6 TaxID=2172005 RepID=UPI0019165302|nr:phage terminase small subunit P27 family [Methylosinus sp. Ce-a6]
MVASRSESGVAARCSGGLRERRTITKADLPTLESYCLACGLVRSSQKLIAAEGELVVTTRGEKKRHPAHQTLFQALTESRRLAAELGLTPASRNKAALAAVDDDLSDFDL